MISSDSISSDEFILRRIPNQTYYLGKLTNPHINHHNFELKDGEEGISCNLESLMSAEILLSRPEAIPGSRVGRARVGDIRAQGFQVVAVEDTNDLTNVGHCEIRIDNRLLLEDKAIRNQLVQIFTLMDLEIAES